MEKVTYSLICVFVLAKKKVSTIETLVPLSKSTIRTKFSLLGPVKNQNYLNYSGPTKLVKVLTAIRTKSSLVGPVKNLHCLEELSKLNCQLNCVNDFILLLRCFLCFVLFCDCEVLS